MRAAVVVVQFGALVVPIAPAAAVGGGYDFSGRIAGYQIATTATTIDAQVQFTLPKVKCPAGDTSTSWQSSSAGIAIFPSIARKGVGAGVNLVCEFGQSSYVATAFVPHDVTWTSGLSAGDVIVASVGTGPTGSGATVVDVTTGGRLPVSGVAVAGDEHTLDVGLFAMACMQGACQSVTTMNATPFSQFNGDGLSLGGASRMKIRDTAGNVEARADELNGTEDAFTVHWVSSCVPAPGDFRC